MQTNETSTLDQLQDMCIVYCDICHFFIFMFRKDMNAKLFELVLPKAYIFVHCMHCRPFIGLI